MANVLAKKALDALAELLHAVHIILVHLPIGAGARGERRDLLVHLIVPGNIGNQILQNRKRLHGEDGDGLIERQGVHAGLTHEPRTAIHFGRAGAALGSLAIPAHGQIGRQVALNVVDGVEDDHSGGDGNAILLGLAALAVAPEDFQNRLGHLFPPYLPLPAVVLTSASSARICFSSSGMAGTGSWRSAMAPRCEEMMLFC